MRPRASAPRRSGAQLSTRTISRWPQPDSTRRAATLPLTAPVAPVIPSTMSSSCARCTSYRRLVRLPSEKRFASRKLADPTSRRGAETVSIMKHPTSHLEYPAIGSTSPLITIFQAFLRLDRCEGSDVTPTCSLPQTTGRSFPRRPAVRARYPQASPRPLLSLPLPA
jgi:hypothetical protein